MAEMEGQRARLELYIHIPLCVRKCRYCDFLSFSGVDDAQRRRYLAALEEEIRSAGDGHRQAAGSSVFFGGGAPSLLTPDEVGHLMEVIRSSFAPEEDCEITMECNPGTVTADSLKEIRSAGIGRLSIGAQSLREEELRTLGRIHDAQAVRNTWTWAAQAGFTNLSLDLMSGIPGQTKESWNRTLEEALALDPAPKHISAYSLIVEEGTPFHELLREGKLELPSEETDRALYAATKEKLTEAGLARYEVSNYAVPGYECRHNLGYWTRVPYLGFGLGASSFYGERRWKNTSDPESYLRAPGRATEEEEVLSREDALSEELILGLRLIRGVSVERIGKLYGVDLVTRYRDVLDRAFEAGLMEIAEGADEDGGKAHFLRFTDAGLDVENSILCEFL